LSEETSAFLFWSEVLVWGEEKEAVFPWWCTKLKEVWGTKKEINYYKDAIIMLKINKWISDSHIDGCMLEIKKGRI
jgi:hypothetical protein